MALDAKCCVENIFQSYLLEIQIAVSIYAIKFKPPEFETSKEYARHIQKIIRDKEKDWHEAFEEEKETLLTEFKNISEFDQSALTFDIHSDSSDDDDALLLVDDTLSENNYQNATTLKSNIEFIEALLHIRNAANLKNNIPSEKYRALLSQMSHNLTRESNAPEKDFVDSLVSYKKSVLCTRGTKPLENIETWLTGFQPRLTQNSKEGSSQSSQPSSLPISQPSSSPHLSANASEDSGYNSQSSPLTDVDHKYILSTDVHQAIRDNQAELTFDKSVQLVLNLMIKMVQVETLNENTWQSGSLLEMSIISIVSLDSILSENNMNQNCRELCFNFVHQLIETIALINNEGACNIMSKILIDLSHSPYICTDCITCLINQIEMRKDIVCHKLSQVGEERFEMCQLDLVEEDIFFKLYGILKDLLSIFVTRRKQLLRENTTMKDYQGSENVRSSKMYTTWKGNLDEIDPGVKKKTAVEWIVVLENLNEVFSKHLTNVVFLNYECLCLLKEDRIRVKSGNVEHINMLGEQMSAQLGGSSSTNQASL